MTGMLLGMLLGMLQIAIRTDDMRERCATLNLRLKWHEYEPMSSYGTFKLVLYKT